MDTSSLQPYKDAVSSANNDVANQTAAAPGLLTQLKQNLTSIFAKDNPFIAERGTALENYLNAPSASRVQTLPQNLPVVAGSNLNLSPTQQDAVTTSRSNAALVPLLGLNQIVTGLYNNIPGMVQGAGDLYNAQITAAGQRANTAQQSLAQAFQELQANQAQKQYQSDLAEKMREFDIQASIQRAGLGNPQGLMNDIQSLIQNRSQAPQSTQDNSGDWEVVNNQSAAQPPAQVPNPVQTFSQPTTNQPTWWDNIMSFFGAGPKQQLATPLGQNLTDAGLNFGSFPGLGR